jgi:hypothetical protein
MSDWEARYFSNGWGDWGPVTDIRLSDVQPDVTRFEFHRTFKPALYYFDEAIDGPNGRIVRWFDTPPTDERWKRIP